MAETFEIKDKAVKTAIGTDKVLVQQADGTYRHVLASDLLDGISGLTTDMIPKAASSTSLVNSLMKDDSVTVNIGGSADASAIFDLVSTTQGFGLPKMTEAERDAIVNPREGLEIMNSDTNVPNFFNGTIWTAAGGGLSGLTSGSVPKAISATDIADGTIFIDGANTLIGANSGITSLFGLKGTNTSNSTYALRIHDSGNTRKFTVSNAGRVGIGVLTSDAPYPLVVFANVGNVMFQLKDSPSSSGEFDWFNNGGQYVFETHAIAGSESGLGLFARNGLDALVNTEAAFELRSIKVGGGNIVNGNLVIFRNNSSAPYFKADASTQVLFNTTNLDDQPKEAFDILAASASKMLLRPLNSTGIGGVKFSPFGVERCTYDGNGAGASADFDVTRQTKVTTTGASPKGHWELTVKGTIAYRANQDGYNIHRANTSEIPDAELNNNEFAFYFSTNDLIIKRKDNGGTVTTATIVTLT